MYKLTKKMLNEHQKKRKVYKSSEKKIINILKNIIKEKRAKKNIPGSWKITGFEICNDDNIDFESSGIHNEKEWVEITEDKYYKLLEETRKYNYNNIVKEEYEPEFEIKHYELRNKKHKYIRCFVHESWGYGGNDDIIYDLLLSDVLDIKDLRKEKLERIEK